MSPLSLKKVHILPCEQSISDILIWFLLSEQNSYFVLIKLILLRIVFCNDVRGWLCSYIFFRIFNPVYIILRWYTDMHKKNLSFQEKSWTPDSIGSKLQTTFTRASEPFLKWRLCMKDWFTHSPHAGASWEIVFSWSEADHNSTFFNTTKSISEGYTVNYLYLKSMGPEFKVFD